jgi:hypothetical protein
VIASVEPAPSDEEREAILAVLSPPRSDPDEGAWAAAALLEGVEESEPEHP